ncbi:hypothetical protein EAF04_001610 [Stromatinia cepivora]|nr:hypothetical protein EAF04_001610 [Stromatinia cepivora]
MNNWPPIINQQMLTFTLPDLTASQTNAGSVPCSICDTQIKNQGYLCMCTNFAYYCSLACRGTHQTTCISWISKRMPRPLSICKLAFYFPPERSNLAVCWIPCPTATPTPCVPSCNECIVCQACHDCHPYDVPLPAPILAHGANTTAATIQDVIESWASAPGISDPEDWTLSVMYGLEAGEILDGCSKNLSIEELTGWPRDWMGPFVMIGITWSDCDGKAKTRDVTMADLETAKKFFISTTPLELGLAEVADGERQENGLMEMNDRLDSVLKRK